MKYTTLAVVNFGAGAVLGLSKAQADARSSNLAAVEGRKGWFTTTAPTQFKRGEEFQYEGDLPKAIAQALEQVEPERKRKPAAEKADKAGETAEAARLAAAQAQAQQREALTARLAELNQAIAASQTEVETDELVKQIEAAEAELAALG
ncbi:hypothetical protein P3G55_18765 [Leptospira sp. 96542]|nr:hypothetical protein [Leptospira sp. 96542]